jgi:hypothetical protein
MPDRVVVASHGKPWEARADGHKHTQGWREMQHSEQQAPALRPPTEAAVLALAVVIQQALP